jgi:hypothetical protein
LDITHKGNKDLGIMFEYKVKLSDVNWCITFFIH